MTDLNDNRDDVVNMRKLARTCSIPQVAEAAVISIGGELARHTSLEAARSGVSRGVYVADIVLAFEREADLRAWARAEQETRGMDQPILAGLRHLLEKRFVSEAVLDERLRQFASPPLAEPSQDDACGIPIGAIA